MEIRLYPQDSLVACAIWKIDKVHTEHRRLGFFQFKLAPVLVAEGVRLNISNAALRTNWLHDSRLHPSSSSEKLPVEWRQFSVYFPSDLQPRLKASRVHPSASAGPVIARLEGVEMQAGPEQLQAPQADLLADGQTCRVIWRDPGGESEWDLVTEQRVKRSNAPETQHETP